MTSRDQTYETNKLRHEHEWEGSDTDRELMQRYENEGKRALNSLEQWRDAWHERTDPRARAQDIRAFSLDHRSEVHSTEPPRWTREPRRERFVEQRGDFAGRGPRDYQRSPERIREDICEFLTDDPRLDATEVIVEVDETGVVDLDGQVDSRSSKRLVEAWCDVARGVRDVRNRLTIVPLSTAATPSLDPVVHAQATARVKQTLPLVNEHQVTPPHPTDYHRS